MRNFFNYIKSKDFGMQVLYAFLGLVTLSLTLHYLLIYYTHHGEGQKVPNFKGMKMALALAKIEEQGLQVQLDSVYILDKTPGIVVEQDPDPYTNVKSGRKVYLTVTTRNAPKIKMPEVVNLDIREAVAILDNYSLKVADTLYKSDIAKDVVLDVLYNNRFVDTGTPISKGSRLTLVLGDGLGANKVFVPDVMGLTIKEAEAVLKRSSLLLGTVSYKGAGDSLKAKVVNQNPEPTDSVHRVSIGTKVKLTLTD